MVVRFLILGLVHGVWSGGVWLRVAQLGRGSPSRGAEPASSPGRGARGGGGAHGCAIPALGRSSPEARSQPAHQGLRIRGGWWGMAELDRGWECCILVLWQKRNKSFPRGWKKRSHFFWPDYMRRRKSTPSVLVLAAVRERSLFCPPGPDMAGYEEAPQQHVRIQGYSQIQNGISETSTPGEGFLLLPYRA
jgi:hypothetical protein